MQVVDELITRFRLDGAAAFVAQAKQINSAAAQAAKSAEKLKSGPPPVISGQGLADQTAKKLWSPVNLFANMIKAGAQESGAAIAAMLAEAELASREAANFDALADSLKAVEGNAQLARKEMENLQNLAKAPGLGFEESVKAFTELRNSGLSDQISEEAIKQFANTNARNSGTKETFARMMLQATQMAEKPHLMGDELMRLTEDGVPAFDLIKKHFGTSDTEELKKMGITGKAVLAGLVIEMQKLERATGGARNSFENLHDSIQYAQVEVGHGVNEVWGPMVDELGKLIDMANKGGAFREMGDELGDLFSVDDSQLREVFVDVLAAVRTGIQLVKIFGDELSKIAKFLAPFLGITWDFATGGIGPMASELFDANKKDLEASLDAGKRRQEQEDKKKKKDDEAKKDSTQDALEKMAADRDKTAANTEKLVKIEKERLNIESRAIGGGAFGQAAFNPVKVTQAIKSTPKTGGEWGAVVGALDDVVNRKVEELVGRLMNRLGYSPTAY